FFQAEDGIRDFHVTGVQTCALPISDRHRRDLIAEDRPYAGWLYMGFAYNARQEAKMDTVEIDIGMVGPASLAHQAQDFIHDLREIGRASCRERAELSAARRRVASEK